jgi:hypothetical protein
MSTIAQMVVLFVAVIACVLMIAVVVRGIYKGRQSTAKTGNGNHLPIWGNPVIAVIAIVLVTGIVLILGELGLLNRFMKQQMNSVFIDLATNSQFLNDNVPKEKLLDMLNTISRAKWKKDRADIDPAIDSLLNAFVDPMFMGPWRKNIVINLEHTISSEGTEEYVDVLNTVEWECLIPTDSSIAESLYWETTMDTIPNTAAELLEPLHLTVGNQSIIPSMVKDTTADGKVVYKITCHYFAYNGAKVKVVMKRKKPIADDVFTYWMTMPTKGYKFIYKYPKTFSPKLYVFGLGPHSPKPIIDSIANTMTWESADTWLLKKHGFHLSWKVNVPSAK